MTTIVFLCVADYLIVDSRKQNLFPFSSRDVVGKRLLLLLVA